MTFMKAIMYLLRSMPFGTAECTLTAPAEVMLILVHASNSELIFSTKNDKHVSSKYRIYICCIGPGKDP